MNNYDVLKIANILSNNLSTQLDRQSVCDNYNSFLLEEQSTGVDRSRAALGMSLQLNYFGLLTNADSPGFDIETISRSFIELAVRLSKPNKVFSGTISFAMGSTLKNLVPNSHFVNIANTYYLEKYLNEQLDDSKVISFQDIESNSFDNDYDLAIIDFELFSHDTQLIDNIWDHIMPGGCMLVSSFSDFGSVYTTKDMHPFYEYLERLCNDSDKHVFHIPVGTSIMYVVKL